MFGSISGSSTSSSSESTTNSSGSSSTELSGQSITSRFDEQAKALLDAFTNQKFDEQGAKADDQYSRENAIADAQGVVQNIFREFSERALPEIYSAERGTGAYNATATQFLANDAFGEAVSRSAQVVQKNIIDYAQLGQNDSQLQISALLDALKLQGSAYERTDLEQESSSIFESTSTTETSGSSTSIGGGLGF